MLVRLGIAAVSAVVLVSGCSSETTSGSATPAKSGGDGGSSETVPDSPLSQAPGEIDPGPYRTTPLPAFGPVGDAFGGRSIEGQRMAEFVTLPGEIDPILAGGGNISTYVIKNGKSLQAIATQPVADVAEANGALAGFSTSRSVAESADEKAIVHAVVRFPDPGAAARAAQDMSVALQTVTNEWGSELEQPGKIDILPDTFVSTSVSNGEFSSNSFTAHNEYVIYTWAKAPEAQKDWTAQTTAKALQLQEPLIDKFPATPPEKYADLPIDLDGVLRLTVPKEGESRYTDDMAVFGPRGAAHRATDQIGAVEYFEKTGMTNMAADATNVYKTRDTDAAKELSVDFGKEVEFVSKLVKDVGPPGVPDAACWKLASTRSTAFYCLVQVDQYLAEIQSKDKTTVHQMAAAQHKMLAAAK